MSLTTFSATETAPSTNQETKVVRFEELAVSDNQSETRRDVKETFSINRNAGIQPRLDKLAYSAGRLFLEIRRALEIQIDEDWSDVSSGSTSIHRAGRDCLKKLGYSGLLGELSALQFLFNDQNSLQEGDYSEAYKIEFMRLLTVAKERILALYASLDSSILQQLPEYCIPSLTRPLKELATAAEWTPYIEEHYKKKPAFAAACMDAMAHIDSTEMSLHQILAQVKILHPAMNAS